MYAYERFVTIVHRGPLQNAAGSLNVFDMNECEYLCLVVRVLTS